MQIGTRLLPTLRTARLQVGSIRSFSSWRSSPIVQKTGGRGLATQAAESANMSGTKNVLGDDLEICCTDPVTGFARDGYCRVTDGDFGVHAIAAEVTQEFLDYTAAQGNDLQTPHPPGFPGLKPGDRWCLCVARWKEAHEAGKAPKVILAATDAKALDSIALDILKSYATE